MNLSDDLATPEFRAAVHPYVGRVHEIRRTERGNVSDITAIAECENGRYFMKAMRNRPGGRLSSLTRERLINLAVRGVSPALLWHAENDAWVVLGFDVVHGRHADIDPGSADLPLVVELVDRIGRIDLPDIACEWNETRWDRFAEEAETKLFRGDSLLYTDIHPSNVIIGEKFVWAVDWAWPTRGAAFIDPALLVLQLVAAGHTPADAESWAQGCAAWGKADATAVNAFAAATTRMYVSIAQRKPDAAWLHAMADAARAWAGYRGVVVTP